MSDRFFAVIAVVAVAAGLFAIFAYSGESPQATGTTQTTPAAPPAPRVPVPAVTLPRADGGNFSSAALRGRSPLLISFFATWCEPCREELPHLIALYQKYHPAGLQVAYITNEDPETARRFAKQMALPFPVLIDADQAVASQFQADSIPTTVVLDKKGRAAGRCTGYSPDLFDQIETLSAQLVRE